MNGEYARHLQHQYVVLDRFIDVLEHERTLLTQAPVTLETLSDVTESKRQIAAELERIETERRRLVAAAGHSADATGSARLAQELGCSSTWQALVARVATARNLNQDNGLAIQSRLDFTTRALAVLRRHTDQTLYAADGQRGAMAGSRINSDA